jgi:uncharacterized membrane protein YkvA (DUF1232 family)
MPLEIKFTLSDADIRQFQDIVDKSRSATNKRQTPEQIEAAARDLIRKARAGELPEFVAIRMQKLEAVINMINDEEWQLNEEECHRVLGVLAYVCEPEDLIPDHIPVLGYLDDAIYAQIVLGELRNEISLYLEFCEYRDTEEERRRKLGEDTKVGREEWLADKRASLHGKMRKGRMSTGMTGTWRMRLWKTP